MEVGGLFGASHYLVGAAASTTFMPLRTEADAGSATVQRRTVLMLFGMRATLARSLDVWKETRTPAIAA
jgi:hypothetical protein